MKDVFDEQQQTVAASSNVLPNDTMHMKRGIDLGRYNEPRHDEVAAAFVSTDAAPPVKRDVVVYPCDQQQQIIPYMSANSDPMVYPHVFPRGDLGWYSGLKHCPDYATKTQNTITILQFYAYHLAFCVGFNPIFYSGKLFQQYIIDSCVRTEGARLEYI